MYVKWHLEKLASAMQYEETSFDVEKRLRTFRRRRNTLDLCVSFGRTWGRYALSDDHYCTKTTRLWGERAPRTLHTSRTEVIFYHPSIQSIAEEKLLSVLVDSWNREFTFLSRFQSTQLARASWKLVIYSFIESLFICDELISLNLYAVYFIIVFFWNPLISYSYTLT